jgi:hypothetical protein
MFWLFVPESGLLWRKTAWLLPLLLLPVSAIAAGQAPVFDLPVNCEIGRQCFIQNYVDLAAGPAVEDHACGQLSYDGHKGTDIRVRDLVALQQGVNVVAAARGKVVALRDGMPDRDVRTLGPASVKGVECGNGVVIDHGRGWQSKYCHMRRGSVLVSRGMTVVPGQPLGRMGMSGNTQFPHLHFEVTRDSKFVDPFNGLHQRPQGQCGGQGLTGSLWKISVAARLKYLTSGVISSGFAIKKPDITGIEKGLFRKTSATVDAPLLVFWIQMYGLQPGDRYETALTGPGDTVLARDGKTHAGRHKAQWYSWIGKRRPKSGVWPAGRYTGYYRLMRKSAAGDWRKVAAIKKIFVLESP